MFITVLERLLIPYKNEAYKKDRSFIRNEDDIDG